MNSVERASEILDVKLDTLSEFSEIDPFNLDNKLTGVICRQSDYRYGALVIFRVNDEECEQIIYGTPKLHYPFNKKGEFRWPDISQIEIWDKLDGSNVLAFFYSHNGTFYLTYKTRLSPILKDGIYGGFLSMWREMLDLNEWIKLASISNPEYNLSFELYGYRNEITIKYRISLDVKLLFGIRRFDHVVRPPSQLFAIKDLHLPKKYVVSDSSDLQNTYLSLQSEMTGINEKVDQPIVEGIVMYAFCNEPSWRLFKCKALDIQKLHWASGGISIHELWTTALNSFENGIQDIDYFIDLLREEYTNEQIERSLSKVKRVYQDAFHHNEFIMKVNKMYFEAKKEGFDVSKNKAETFRFMSKFFDKKEMRKVGSIILKGENL